MSHKQSGFTLIELTMAILFVSILIMAVAQVTVSAGRMYQKGTTLKTTNQKSREVMDTIRRDVMQAGSDATIVSTPNSGVRWCLGSVSYAFNTAEALYSGDTTKLIKKEDGEPIRLVRVVDGDRQLCGSSPYQMTIADSMSPVDLIAKAVPELVVYKASMNSLATTPTQTLYEVAILLGTFEKTGANTGIVDSTYHCRPNTDPSANPNYCSVVELKTIVRAGGGK